jgi:hypothetical protein
MAVVAMLATVSVDARFLADVQGAIVERAAPAPIASAGNDWCRVAGDALRSFAATPAPPVAGERFLGIRDDDIAEAAAPAPRVDPAPPPSPDERPVIVSIGRETWVLSEPRWEGRKLGYLRAGAIVTRDREPVTTRDCRGGWYRVEPRGYVCAGSRATTDPHHPIAELSARRPDLHALPYLYGLTRYPTPPLYVRLPTQDEQRATEGDLASHLRGYAAIGRKPDFVVPPPADATPTMIADRSMLPAIGGEIRGRDQLTLGQARMRSGWAFLASYELEGRRFGLTTDLTLVPLDRVRLVQPSSFHGIAISDELGLPIAIVRAKLSRSYELQPTGLFAAKELLAWRQAVPLTGREQKGRDGSYLEARDGSWVRRDQLTVIERFQEAPRFARRGEKWIDVSILRQTLVAYEGTRPVYATLVSTGKDGIVDHRESHATIQGTFLVHTKHISVTMDGDEQGDEFDLRDVPFVQYFTEGYALHAAYWHDDFGTPRSHGCVNLAPIDAAWLFGWTTPDVPEGWHASLSLKQGTIVHIHP